MKANTFERKSILFSLAHPDDESFGNGGTIARYASMGTDIHLICATNGEAGTAAGDLLAQYRSMAELRISELCCAVEVLGIASLHMLGYRDSGMAGTDDNLHPDSLHQADIHEVTLRIVSIIRTVKPQILITFDPSGGYGHPDHIKMHLATTAAFQAAGDSAVYCEGLAPYKPQKLYYGTFPKTLLRFMVLLLPLFGLNPEKMGTNNDLNLRDVAQNDYPIHARISTRKHTVLAQQARDCHYSQLGGMKTTRLLTALQKAFLVPSVNTYTRAYPPVSGNRINERDLFDGVILSSGQEER